MDYQELDEMIERLRVQIHEADPYKGYWKDLWQIAGEIGAGFKGSRYHSKADKDTAWKRFQELCAQAKAKGDLNKQEMATRQQAWDEKKTRSERTRSGIEGRAASASPASGIERAIADLILYPLTIIEKIIDTILGISAKSEFEKARDELRQCSTTLKKAWDTFSASKNDLLPADKAHCYETLTKAQDRLNEAWTRLKQAQDQFYSNQRAAHAQRQKEWEEKNRDFKERVSANIDKLEANISKTRSALSRQESHLDKLESDYASAWNDNFKEKCSEWIDEAKSKIADMEASIERMEGWLNEERAKLR